MYGAATAICSPFKPSGLYQTRLRYFGLRMLLAHELHFSTVANRRLRSEPPGRLPTPAQGPGVGRAKPPQVVVSQPVLTCL